MIFVSTKYHELRDPHLRPVMLEDDFIDICTTLVFYFFTPLPIDLDVVLLQ